MPTVRYIARHDDLGAFTHGKLDVPDDEYRKVMSDNTLGVESDSLTFVTLYRSVLRTYETKGVPCQTCGNRRTFVPNPLFRITVDPANEAHECTLRGVVKAKCLACAFAAYVVTLTR